MRVAQSARRPPPGRRRRRSAARPRPGTVAVPDARFSSTQPSSSDGPVTGVARLTPRPPISGRDLGGRAGGAVHLGLPGRRAALGGVVVARHAAPRPAAFRASTVAPVRRQHVAGAHRPADRRRRDLRPCRTAGPGHSGAMAGTDVGATPSTCSQRPGRPVAPDATLRGRGRLSTPASGRWSSATGTGPRRSCRSATRDRAGRPASPPRRRPPRSPTTRSSGATQRPPSPRSPS